MDHPYASALYAEALAGVGRAVWPRTWRTFVLARPLPGAIGEDAMGAYPLAAISADADLKSGLGDLSDQGLMSLVLVADPLCGAQPERLAEAFSLCRPFKTHYLVNPAAGGYAPSTHHRERIRRGLRRCRVERVALADHLNAWSRLYDGLVERRGVHGTAAFDAAYFAALARTPGLEAFAAYVGEDLAAMTLWFAHAGVVYNHLTASNALGYANGATFALYDAAIAHFSGEGVVNLGGGAGVRDDPDDGLAAFKSGFANDRTTAYLCGAILDPGRYQALSVGRAESDFFPAYRA